MLLDSSTYFQQERVECSIQAARHYQIPALVLLAVAEQEGGKPGHKVRNRNGTFDYGAMQINTVSLADLRKFGIHEKHVLAKGCYPYYLAAWRIAGHLKDDSGDIWQRAANYHSRTPYFNRIYRAGLIRKAEKIAHRLNRKEPIADFTSALASQSKQTDNQNAYKPKKLLFQDYFSAPIRIKSFDSLHSYSFEATDPRATPNIHNSAWIGQPMNGNGW